MKIYLDTSVISALFDNKNPERKALTEEFFSGIRLYRTYISELSLVEIAKTPDKSLRDKMRQVAKRFSILEINEEVEKLASEYVRYKAVPKSYSEDTYHIAVAVLNEIDYLLSWNFRHIVRKRTRDIVRMINTLRNLKSIEIITPGELL
ncbi:PIN domain-containing protein [Candidatus Aerophobetes bacterium]|nr:PIN domain-containing protein [Candidatus Aerophobetes bacterium]